MKKSNSPQKILISRTDSIGDVILTLPICIFLKSHFPHSEIIFLGRKYTEPILKCCPAIDQIIIWDHLSSLPKKEAIKNLQSYKVDVCIHVFPRKEIAQLVKKSGIPVRIGTSHRLFHLTTCNLRPNFTRKHSDLHEAQLNFKLLKYFEVETPPSLEEIISKYLLFTPQQELSKEIEEFLSQKDKKYIVLHPKSQGSAVEWPIDKYIALAQQLIKKECVVFFSGTEEEGKLFRNKIPQHPNIIDISGKCSLGEFITFISKCDGLVACSTGPLHIAAMLGIRAIGLYSNLRPIHPGRWKPLGKKSQAIVVKTKNPPKREDIISISVETALEKLLH